LTNNVANQQPPTASTEPGSIRGIGLVVFMLGILMMVAAFWWGYQLIDGIEAQISQVSHKPAVATPASEAVSSSSPTLQAKAVVARPQSDLTLGQTAAVIGLKLLGLAVLAYIGALVASRGAGLTQVRRPTP